MDPIRFNRFSVPIVTGTPGSIPNKPIKSENESIGTKSFQQILQQQIDSGKEAKTGRSVGKQHRASE